MAMNPLMPQDDDPQPQGGAPQAPAGNPGGFPDGMLDGLQGEHEAAAAQHKKVQNSNNTLSRVQKELDGLVALGDKVSPEDVIEAGGGLVAAGLSPKAVAALLAQMPQGGEALAAWIQQQDAQVAQQEAAAKQALEAARHQMGMSALNTVMAHDLHSKLAARQAQASASPVMQTPMAPGPSSGDLPNG